MRVEPELARRLISLAINGGATDAEVYMKASSGLSVEAKSGATDAVETSRDFGYCLRVLRDGRPGFSYSTNPVDADRVARDAVESSKWTEKDEFLAIAMPVDGEETGKPEIFDLSVESITEEAAAEAAIAIERGAVEADRRIRTIRKAEASFSSGETLIANSRGLMRTFRSSACSAHIMAVAEEGGESQMGWDFDGSRFLDDVDFESVGRSAALRAINMLGAAGLSSIKAPVILENTVSSEFLGIFSTLLSSEAVQKGKSLLRGKRGERIISPKVSIVDDGLMDRRLGSRPFDDEGSPAARKTLVSAGVLDSYMYNIYTANKDGVKTTGNASRPGITGMPGIGPMNLYIEPAGTEPRSLDALFREMGRGLYILEAMGVHMANPISGEFSLGVSGLWVEGGEVKNPVKEAVISGNILDFFGRIEAIGNDLRFLGGIGAPSLMVSDIDISG